MPRMWTAASGTTASTRPADVANFPRQIAVAGRLADSAPVATRNTALRPSSLRNSCLIEGRGAGSVLPMGGRIGDDGTEARGVTGAALRVLPGVSRPARPRAAVHRSLRRPGRHPHPSGGFLQPYGPSVCRSRTADTDAVGRIMLRHPVRAAALRRGASEHGVSLVMPPRSFRQGAGSLDLLQEPPRPVS